MKLANVQDNNLDYKARIFIEDEKDLQEYRRERNIPDYATMVDKSHSEAIASGKKLVINPNNQFSYFTLSSEGTYQILN